MTAHLDHVRAGMCPAVRPFSAKTWCELPVEHHGPHRAPRIADGWDAIEPDKPKWVFW